MNLDETQRTVRSRSTGLGFARLMFPRSHSTGHSLVRQSEDCERFTLRLPEEVRNWLVNTATLSRTKSCGVALMQSERKGYRMTRSDLQYERFGREIRSDRWGFTCAPPFFNRAGSMRSTKDANNKATIAISEVDEGERSSDRLYVNNNND